MPPEPETIEAFKYWAEYLKHLTTLSTGSILLITTFLEKLFSHPRWKWVVVISLCGFLSAVIGAVLCFTVMALASHEWDQDGRSRTRSDLLTVNSIAPSHWGWKAKMADGGVYVAWIGFLVGIFSLTVFAIRNLI